MNRITPEEIKDHISNAKLIYCKQFPPEMFGEDYDCQEVYETLQEAEVFVAGYILRTASLQSNVKERVIEIIEARIKQLEILAQQSRWKSQAEFRIHDFKELLLQIKAVIIYPTPERFPSLEEVIEHGKKSMTDRPGTDNDLFSFWRKQFEEIIAFAQTPKK